MSDHPLERSRFAMVMRGYDRNEVDAVLADYEHWADDAQVHMEQAEVRFREAGRRADALEARVGELQERADAPTPAYARSLEERADKLLETTRQAASQLRADVEAEARAERDEALRAATELTRAAEARAAEIREAARREERQAAPSEDTRREAARRLEEGRAAAEQRSRAVWEEAQGSIRQAQLELERLDKRRQIAIEELARLQGSLEDLVRVS